MEQASELLQVQLRRIFRVPNFDSPATDSTTAVLLTPPGRGAVAVVQVQGPQALVAVRQLFIPAQGAAFANPTVDRIYFGHWREPTGEEVVVATRSMHDPVVIEIHGHGGLAAPQAILDDLRSAGCEIGTWQQAVQRQSQDAILAAAHIALADAPTARTAGILLDQYRGTLAAAFAEIEQPVASGTPELTQQKLQRLADLIPVGQHLTTPWKVVLAGKPNVGKSSLMNRLVGYERSIVFDQPGTTRDVLEATTSFDGWPVRLIDCAGLGDSTDAIEREGVSRARQALATAELVLVVIDAREPLTEVELGMLSLPAPTILVANKIDLVAGASATLAPPPSNKRCVETSATTGQGLEDLVAQIVATLVPQSPQPGEAVPFAVEHFEYLNQPNFCTNF
jgi:tRNA modification GTPase